MGQTGTLALGTKEPEAPSVYLSIFYDFTNRKQTF